MRPSSRNMTLESSRRSVETGLQLSQTDEHSPITYAYDEKAAYEQRCQRRQSNHNKHNSYDSKSSFSSSASSLDDEKYDNENPPRYVHSFYNTIDDKPLPPLPGSQTRRVRFVMVDKPLPPLPAEHHKRERANSSEGEHAWWSKRFEMGDSEYDTLAREKETS